MINALSSRHILAICLSLILHFIVLTSWSDARIDSARLDNPKADPLFVQLNFDQPTPKAAQLPQPIKKREPVTQPKPKPKPIPKPKPKIVKKTVQPKKKPPEPQITQAKQSPAVVETVEEIVAPPPSPAKAQPKANLLEQYMAKLLASIEEKKRYPTLARRKNIEGRVKVSFELACDGRITDLDISGSHSLLRKAANKAINAAYPFPKIPAEIRCPLPITYAMAYTLDK